MAIRVLALLMLLFSTSNVFASNAMIGMCGGNKIKFKIPTSDLLLSNNHNYKKSSDVGKIILDTKYPLNYNSFRGQGVSIDTSSGDRGGRIVVSSNNVREVDIEIDNKRNKAEIELSFSGIMVRKLSKVTSQSDGDKIAIDPGHGIGDPGAIGRKSKEEDITRRAAKILRAALARRGNTIIYTTPPDWYRSKSKRQRLEYRSIMANNNNVDKFISIHANGSTNKNSNGVEVYYRRGDNSSKRMAYNIYKAFVRDRIHKTIREPVGKSFSVLKLTHAPAVLIELGYITNRQDEKKINSYNYLDKIAKSIASIFGTTKVSVSSETISSSTFGCHWEGLK